LIHSEPVLGDFTIQVPIAYRGTFQLRPQRFSASVGHVVLHRAVDELAAHTWFGQAVNSLNGGCRQNNVDAFAHEILQ